MSEPERIAPGDRVRHKQRPALHGRGTVLTVSHAGRLLVRWERTPEEGEENPRWEHPSRVRRAAT